jgi:glycerophosphoryl diester phosphodiesterase
MHRYATLLIAALASPSAGAVDIVALRPDPRPVALVAGLEDGPLKRQLAACTDDPVRRTSFSLGHRGAPLHYPEHTRESYVAAAAMGAGVIECDVTFTRDKQLVCRHAQDDLHTTTDILLTPLAARCAQPFRPAQFARCAASATGPTRVRAPSRITSGAARPPLTPWAPAPAP